MFNLVPILIGAAVGAGTSALFGKDPLKGAALGGLGGGLFGPAGSFGGSGGGAASGLNVVGSSVPASAAANSAATQAGLVFNPATGSFLNPEYFALASGANPIYTGAGGVGSQFATGVQSLLETPLAQGLKDYMPSGQAIGSLGLQAAMTPRPQVTAPAGGITPGRAPDMSAVQGLISTMRRSGQQIPADYFG